MARPLRIEFPGADEKTDEKTGRENGTRKRDEIEKLTSYDNASIGSGNVVNDSLFKYNEFAQLSHDYQAHSGAVNESTTPRVQYGYADGSANTIRAASITYPNGRVLTYDYGSSGGINDAASRVEAIVDDDAGSPHLAEYSYLGTGTFVEVDCYDLRSRILPLRMPTDAATQLALPKADVIFVDADHTQSAVYRDLTLYAPHLRSGGVICGDDWRWQDERGAPSVQNAVTTFLSDWPEAAVDVAGNIWSIKPPRATGLL